MAKYAKYLREQRKKRKPKTNLKGRGKIETMMQSRPAVKKRARQIG